MNDGSPTFQSSPNVSPSVIDLSIVSRPLALLINQETSLDLHGSDHFPIRITIRDTQPTTFCFSHRFHLSPAQLSFIQDRLALRAPSLKEELSFQPALSPIKKYDRFCQILNEVISVVYNSKNFFPQKKRVLNTKIPARGGTGSVLRQLHVGARCAESTNLAHPGTIGFFTNAATPNAKNSEKGKKERMA